MSISPVQARAGSLSARLQRPDPASREPDRAILEQLRRTDRDVRAHESAHRAAAGELARGGTSFDTVRGPDGRAYAVAGEVHIDTSDVPGDARATLQKAARIRAAALAPRDPSAQDRKVAAEAAALAASARAELRAGESDAPSSDAEVGDGAVAQPDTGTELDRSPKLGGRIDLFG